jgi:hypothetical protein
MDNEEFKVTKVEINREDDAAACLNCGNAPKVAIRFSDGSEIKVFPVKCGRCGHVQVSDNGTMRNFRDDAERDEWLTAQPMLTEGPTALAGALAPMDHDCFHCAMHGLYRRWNKSRGVEAADVGKLIDSTTEFLADIVLDSQDTLEALAAAYRLVVKSYEDSLQTKMNINPENHKKWLDIIEEAVKNDTVPEGFRSAIVESRKH